MNDDELRRRLARSDPARDVSATDVNSPDARALMEDIMNTTRNERDMRTHDRTRAGSDSPSVGPTVPPPTPPTVVDGGDRSGAGRRRWLVGIASVAAAAALAVGGFALLDPDDDPDSEIAEPTVPSETSVPTESPVPGDLESLTLSLGEGQDPMASCIRPSPEVLAPVELAFAGTATAVGGESVTLEVTRWYTGGDADLVELRAPAGLEALIGGIDFEVGADYLISATGTTVNYCGLSGPATPELQALFDGAFSG